MSGNRSWSRREILAALGSATVAGCAGDGEHPDTSTTGTTTDTPTKAPTDTQTSTEEPTETAENEWEVDPLEHDNVVGAFYYPWYDQHYWDAWDAPEYPALGRYDSRDVEVINQHVKWSVEHGIYSWVVNWNTDQPRGTWVEDHFLESELSDEISFLMHPAPSRFTWNDGYADFDDPATRDTLESDLRHCDVQDSRSIFSTLRKIHSKAVGNWLLNRGVGCRRPTRFDLVTVA